MVATYTCKTLVMETWNAKIGTGSLFNNTNIIVPLAASGSSLCASLYFSTTDSNGGSCVWIAN